VRSGALGMKCEAASMDEAATGNQGEATGKGCSGEQPSMGRGVNQGRCSDNVGREVCEAK
jgi:hypothetical protein